MRSRTTREFRRLLGELPMRVRVLARKAHGLFLENPHHPGLQFKKVHPTEPIYSARISAEYRAVGLLRGDVIVWFWIGSHADYDALLKRI